MADITATVGQSNSTTANINVDTSSGPQTVSVSLPSAQAAQNSSLQLKLLGDVDTTTLNDGAILQYRSSDAKFVTTNEIVTSTGTLTINAGELLENGNSNSDKRSSGTTTVPELGELKHTYEQEHKVIMVTEYSLVRVVLTVTVTQIM